MRWDRRARGKGHKLEGAAVRERRRTTLYSATGRWKPSETHQLIVHALLILPSVTESAPEGFACPPRRHPPVAPRKQKELKRDKKFRLKTWPKKPPKN